MIISKDSNSLIEGHFEDGKVSETFRNILHYDVLCQDIHLSFPDGRTYKIDQSFASDEKNIHEYDYVKRESNAKAKTKQYTF